MWGFYSVDARLALLNGKQPTPLLGGDLPSVAHALVCAIRKQGRASVGYWRDRPIIHLVGPGFDQYVLGTDWVKIAPYLADGTLDPLEVPTVNIGQQNFSSDRSDPVYSDLYRRVYGILVSLFTDTAPTT